MTTKELPHHYIAVPTRQGGVKVLDGNDVPIVKIEFLEQWNNLSDRQKQLLAIDLVAQMLDLSPEASC